MYRLAVASATEWPVYNGADPAIIAQAKRERDDDLENHVGNAIELAILGKARKFIKSSACQKVINAIWCGKCVYQAQNSHSILSDTYKRNPVHFYDPHKAPLLDHYRLKVPAIRSVLEYTNFLLLFVLFAITIEFSEPGRINVAETFFMVYGLGFSLEKIAAMQEHGIKVYFKGTWNGFDLAFVALYSVYAVLRLYGVYHHELWALKLGNNFVAIIASFMFPRLAFVTLQNNLMVLSLRAMFMQFMILMLIAAFCFIGFLYALWTLSRNNAHYSLGTIAWWMLDLYFGLDASGFDRASHFHSVFGPILMVTYACLSNTLLLTVLVSILSNTFARINEDAAAEAMFRRAVLTIEGVKADSLFSYQPPVNVLALCIMLPASYVLSPRWFHKVNVFVIRITNLPILLMISWYERQAKKAGTGSFYDTLTNAAERVLDTLPRSLKRMTIFEGLAGSGGDIDAIFEIEEEFDSALDTNDSNGPIEIQPGLSIRRRSSGSMSVAKRPMRSGTHRSGSPTSTQRTVPRLRVDSLLSNKPPQGFLSPLAQIYPSLVDQIPEEQGDWDDASANGSAATGATGSRAMSGVSNTPHTRRRLMSMQQQHPNTHASLAVPSVRRVGHAETPTSAIPAGRSTGDTSPAPAIQVQRSSGSDTGEKLPTCMSPEQLVDVGDEPPKASALEDTIEEAEEAGADPAITVDVGRRLNDIEKRQERIEGLLEQIVSKL